MFTNEELRNLLALVQRANITGAEAVAVVQLSQKLNGLIISTSNPEDKPGEAKEGPKAVDDSLLKASKPKDKE